MLASKVVSTSSGEFTIAPLTLRQCEQMFPEGSAGPTASALIFQSLQNAGWDRSEDDLKDLLSPRAVKELSAAILDLTGLIPTGEAMAAESLGATSTAA